MDFRCLCLLRLIRHVSRLPKLFRRIVKLQQPIYWAGRASGEYLCIIDINPWPKCKTIREMKRVRFLYLISEISGALNIAASRHEWRGHRNTQCWRDLATQNCPVGFEFSARHIWGMRTFFIDLFDVLGTATVSFHSVSLLSFGTHSRAL